MKWVALLLLLLAPQDPDIDLLIKQLEDDSAVVRDEAARALVKAGDKAVPKLKSRMETAESGLRKVCLEILEMIAVPKDLRGILPPITRVTIEAKDRNVQEVLEEFQIQTRMPLRIKDAGSAKISVSVKEASPLEALDSIFRAANLNGYYRSGEFGRVEFREPSVPKVTLLEGPELRLSQGYIPKPRRFVRHYAVELWEIVMTQSNDFKKGRSRRELTLTMHCSPGVRPHVTHLEVKSMVDDRGNQLFEGPDDPTQAKGWGSPMQSGIHNRIRFKEPAPGARALSSIRGTARLFFLKSTKSVTFDTPEKAIGMLKEVDGRSAKLVEFKDQKVRVLIDAGERIAPVVVRAHLEGGKIVGPFEGTRVKDSPEALFDFGLYGLPGALQSLEVVVDAVLAEDSFDFEFKDVPLP